MSVSLRGRFPVDAPLPVFSKEFGLRTLAGMVEHFVLKPSKIKSIRSIGSAENFASAVVQRYKKPVP
jgi:hypothetical protein